MIAYLWEGTLSMRFLALVLGIITVVCVTMVGAISGMMGQVPERSFLRILGHYLAHKDFAQGLSRVEAREGLRHVRHRLGFSAISLLVGAVIAGGMGGILRSQVGYGAAATLAVIALNVFIIRAMFAGWIKRLGRPPR